MNKKKRRSPLLLPIGASLIICLLFSSFIIKNKNEIRTLKVSELVETEHETEKVYTIELTPCEIDTDIVEEEIETDAATGVVTEDHKETLETTGHIPETGEETNSETEYEVAFYGKYNNLSENDIRFLSAVVTCEGGSESYECQMAIASVILNRMEYYGGTLQDIIFAEDQFDTAYAALSTEPFECCVQAVNEVLQNGRTLPWYVMFFREGYYHNWADYMTSSVSIDHTYFSYDGRLVQ